MSESLVARKMIDILSTIGVFMNESEVDERLHLDSLQYAVIFMEIEEEFDITVDSEFQDLLCIRDYVRVIQKKKMC